MTLHEDYNKFMQEIISKDYAKESQATPKMQRMVLTTSQSQYHPNKPDKIRVAFDCNVEFNGRSINKELIPGPDLASQLANHVGILTRFRENKVAFMADIEKMYFEIFVLYLKFLSWRDGNILDEPIVHEMCVNVFGGVSCGACSSYALKRKLQKLSEITFMLTTY